MKRLYVEIFIMFVFMAAIIAASFKVPNAYLACVCLSALALAIFGVSIGIRLENYFGEKK